MLPTWPRLIPVSLLLFSSHLLREPFCVNQPTVNTTHYLLASFTFFPVPILFTTLPTEFRAMSLTLYEA